MQVGEPPANLDGDRQCGPEDQKPLQQRYAGLSPGRCADHGKAQRVGERIAQIVEFSESEFRAVRALFVHDPEDAYTVLGTRPDISDEDLKFHYRKLVREHHPDAATARGVPEEFVEMANRKLAAINAAFEEVARERGL